MSVEQKILDKLQKLLALSASNNENEAALAMEKAQALMNEHNLTVLDVAEDGSGAVVKNKEVWGLTKSRQKWESILGNSVAETFNGRAIFTKTLEGWYFTFIATKTDMEIIVDLFERLRQTVRRMSNYYVDQQRRRQPRLSAKTLHNSYRRGIITTVHSRLQALKENTRPDVTTFNRHGLTGMDLVVVKNQAVNQRVAKLFPDVRVFKSTKVSVNANAYNQGRQDGNNVSLHRAVGGKNPAAITIDNR